MLSIDKKSIEFGGFVPINPINYQKRTSIPQQSVKRNYLNSTQLPVNERYRRLIPYMTFYLANDFSSPQNDAFISKVQLQKVAVVPQPQNGKSTIQYNEIPRYQGNRLSQFNIASAYPNKIIQDYLPNENNNFALNQSPLRSEAKYAPIQSIMRAPPKQTNIFDFQRPIPVPVKASADIFNTGDLSHLNYYSNPLKESQQQYKLIPYEQTPPVHVPDFDSNDDYYIPLTGDNKKSVAIPVAVAPEYYKQTNAEKYDSLYKFSVSPQVEVVSNGVQSQSEDEENNLLKKYALKKPSEIVIPTTETGFKPIFPTSILTTSGPKYTYITPEPYHLPQSSYLSSPEAFTTRKPTLYYKTRPTKIPTSTQTTEGNSSPYINYGPSSGDQFEQNNLAKILKSLQKSNSLPQTITAENIGSSIKALVQILNSLKERQRYVDSSTIRPILSTPVPFQTTVKQLTNGHSNTAMPRIRLPPVKPISISKASVTPQPVHEYPPQDLEVENVVEQPGHGDESSQSFPANNDEVGGTPGHPGIDYPTLSVIPTTSFDCKTQRYKGFFGDPETKCQVWHYCDLNGGQASFLCPNGTIFSQVALTCDWWFNVKCSTTTQLYVLNERLYKYILPYSPKFPEDYSGPLVDKYLAIKYKEMEEKMKKKKKVLKPETILETEKADVIEIKTSGMSGALSPYGN
ncbi:uncharacterized protein LOC143912600 [Arctopsyche grandis]|uniref:uncharacterized protein LOC143912600 n=1 Tax=Arctopsyche grandis TaxID=121162 RepID=UPI00406D6CF3